MRGTGTIKRIDRYRGSKSYSHLVEQYYRSNRARRQRVLELVGVDKEDYLVTLAVAVVGGR